MTADIEAFGAEVAAQATAWAERRRATTPGCNAARKALHPLAERCRDLTKQIDLAAKLAGRVIDIAVKELDARESDALGQWRREQGAQGAGERAGRRRSRRCGRRATS